MRRLFLVTLLIFAVPLIAQEKITLTVAESNTDYRIGNLTLISDDPATAGDEGAIILDLKGLNQENISCRYSGATNPTGTFLITAMNKRNFSTAYAGNATTGSLRQTIHHRLFSGGLNEGPAICGRTLTGTLTGSVP